MACVPFSPRRFRDNSAPRLSSPSVCLLASMSAFVALSVATSAHALVLPEEKDEAIAPIVNEVILSASVFPSDGLITGTFYCSSVCFPEDLQFIDGDGMVVAGTFVDVSATRPDLDFAFLPDAPLAVGMYSTRLLSGYSSAIFSVEASTEDLPTVTSTVVAQMHPAGEPVTCLESASGVNPGNFHESSETRAGLTVAIQGVDATQFAFTLELESGEDTAFLYGLNHQVDLGSEARVVCFDVTATPLQGGETINLGNQCVDTSTVENIGVSEGIFGNSTFVLTRCTVPPAGYEDEWCDLFAQAAAEHTCDGMGDFDACVAARYDCPLGDLPEYEHTLAEDPSNPKGATKDGDGDENENAEESAGCSCRMGAGVLSRGGSSGFLLLLLGGATLYRRRTRATRPSV